MLLKWNKNLIPTSINLGDKTSQSPKDIANHVIKFFVEKVNKIVENIGNPITDPLDILKTALETWDTRHNLPPLTFQNISLEKTKEYIKSLKSSNSSGLDNISTTILKDTKENLAPILRHITNLSITQ